MILKCKILVVDDQKTHRLKMLQAITSLGHEADSASDGSEALSMMRDNNYHLILLDIVMPEMDGFEVMKRMQEDPVLKEIPVIVISALDSEMDKVVQAIEFGAEDFLPKNFDRVLLNARVNSSLEKKFARDREIRDAKQVKRLTNAAAKLEKQLVIPNKLELDDISAMKTDIGGLSRVFSSMAAQIYEREKNLVKTNATLKLCCIGLAIGFFVGLGGLLLT